VSVVIEVLKMCHSVIYEGKGLFRDKQNNWLTVKST